MKRYILTGTPGAGKTTVLGCLERLGYGAVEEAATAVIARGQARGEAEPWTGESFVEDIVRLQRRRQLDAAAAMTALGGAGDVQFYDRSPVCTHALSVYLGRPLGAVLTNEIERIVSEQVYQPRVFFLRNLGFCEPTAARRISFEESLVFERIHEQSYRSFGFELIDIPAGEPAERAAAIVSAGL
ncbi:ATP/GTP-binding protein [Streptacidiphilus sp. PAMC 29251]